QGVQARLAARGGQLGADGEIVPFGRDVGLEREVVQQLVGAHVLGGQRQVLVDREQHPLGRGQAHAVVVAEVGGGAPALLGGRPHGGEDLGLGDGRLADGRGLGGGGGGERLVVGALGLAARASGIALGSLVAGLSG